MFKGPALPEAESVSGENLKISENIRELGSISIWENCIIIWQRATAGPSILTETKERMVNDERSAKKPQRNDIAPDLKEI